MDFMSNMMNSVTDFVSNMLHSMSYAVYYTGSTMNKMPNGVVSKSV